MAWTVDGDAQWRLGSLEPFAPHRPVVHVSWFEADAFARAHGARLPTESEWEKAATWDQEQSERGHIPGERSRPSLGCTRPSISTAAARRRSGAYRAGASPYGCLGMIGDVWEWTADEFSAYPGFVAYPYKEYSEVFFGSAYKVLRGGSWATRARVAAPTFRNWDYPQRRQIFSGIRIAKDLPSMRPTPKPISLATATKHREDCRHEIIASHRRDRRLVAVRVGRALPGQRRARRPHEAVQGASAQALLRHAGLELFERICELPEYYPTRTERLILEQRAREIIELTGAGELVELGSGSADKARILLDAMASARTLRRYVALDVSESVVRDAAEQLTSEFHGLRVHGVIGDFERHLERVPEQDGVPRIVALLGGTIGNFPPGTRRALLRRIGSLLGPEDRLLLGTDLVKDPTLIEAAYDDRQGVTAEFNRNVLHVLNRELGADFVPEAFDHVAFYDRRHDWIEMRLRARRPCSVRIADLGMRVEFAAGEELRTEISAKFTHARVRADFQAAGLALERWLPDPDGLFALSLSRRANSQA